MNYFPEKFLDNLTSDEGLLLPEERLGVAELCIRFSGEPTALPALIKYMCREYILDKSRYHKIRDKVGARLGRAKSETATQSIWDGCRSRVWAELPEFKQLAESVRPEVESGLVELLSDAFAAAPQAQLPVLKAARRQGHVDVETQRMFRRFAIKAGRKDPSVRAWLHSEAQRSANDKSLKRIAEDLGAKRAQNQSSPKALLREYLERGDQSVYNELRFSKDKRILEVLATQLSGHCSSNDLDRILHLLLGFQNRNRAGVINIVLQNWQRLCGHNYRTAAEVLGSYPVAPHQRDEVAQLLNRDLGGKHAEIARRTLEQMLR